jgi:tRNA(fMet)-specific endonuclease VapC
MAESPYLLDTSVLLPLIRGKELGRYIDATYKLSSQPGRHLICSVTHGEILALAAVNRWGSEKRGALQRMLESLVTVDIYDDDVIACYVEMVTASRNYAKGSRENVGQNDLWIAAVTKASGSVLLTADKDFDHLHPAHIQRIYIDQKSRLVSDLPQ